MSLTTEVLEQLQAPFSDDRICVKVQGLNKEKTRARLVKYLQHTDVADRLDTVDPTWSNKIHKVEPMDRESSGFFVHMELTVCGVTRDNVGEGSDPKGAASDALKRCASSFGVGRYLYDEPTVWTDYVDSDRYREWTLADYNAALGARGERVSTAGRSSPVQPLGKTDPAPTKMELVREVRALQDALNLSERSLISWANDCAGVSPDKMGISQLQKFVGELQIEARKAKRQ